MVTSHVDEAPCQAACRDGIPGASLVSDGDEMEVEETCGTLVVAMMGSVHHAGHGLFVLLTSFCPFVE